MYSWLWQYLLESSRRSTPADSGPLHVLLCVADHFEPGHGKVAPEVADARVSAWVRRYPELFGSFRDSDGRPPRHTFFYPLEMYRREEVESLSDLCRTGYGEIEVHLHHENDTGCALRKRLIEWKQLLHQRHGMLAQDRHGEIRYAFIHGNWALDNSLPDGRCCGVNNELDVLRETGCYADFTFPSYPSPTQTRKINSIYYAVDDPHKPKSHDWGMDIGAGLAPLKSLMLVQGPLLLNWRSRKFGLLPRVENGSLQGNHPPSEIRVNLWLKARIQVPSRPDWIFVKLHAHGAPEQHQRVLLGEPMVRLHSILSRRAREDRQFHYHYITAREMYNLARAAEAGWLGSVAEARDFELSWSGDQIREPESGIATRSPDSRAAEDARFTVGRLV